MDVVESNIVAYIIVLAKYICHGFCREVLPLKGLPEQGRSLIHRKELGSLVLNTWIDDHEFLTGRIEVYVST